MTRAAQPFGKGASLAVIAGGALVFLLLLYAIGAGWNGRRDNDGGAHAAANGLNGYSALVRLIERQGQPVVLSRSSAAFESDGLLVLTPPHGADADELRQILVDRAYFGPTLVILPKWFAAPLAEMELDQIDARPGWVRLIAAEPPPWIGELELAAEVEAEAGQVRRWAGLGLEGALPGTEDAQFLTGSGLTSFVVGPEREILAAYGYTTQDDADLWPITFIAEPDLMNNQGLADKDRAMLASRIIATAQEQQGGPVVFDLTLPGLGRRPNLLTLAFEPPFLAATLCLLLAALVIGWRGFHRFGPAVAGMAGLAPGKRLLAANGAALIERARRVHLLGAPYAALAAARIAKKLGVTESSPDRREAAIMRIARGRGHGELDIAAALQALREARRPAELLRAARAMRTIERTLLP